MAILTTFLTMLVVCVSTTHSIHLSGDFGRQRFEIDLQFGPDEMTVTMHKPINAPDTFRETTNLHIFSRHLVAMKNWRDRQCYVRYFVESEDQMKGRVENAVYNNGGMGNITEERFILDGIPPLSKRTVNVLLGPKIASFCRNYDVFAIGHEDYIVLDPKVVVVWRLLWKRVQMTRKWEPVLAYDGYSWKITFETGQNGQASKAIFVLRPS